MATVDLAIYATDRWGTPKGRVSGVSVAKRTRKTSGTDTLDLTCETQLIKGDRLVFQDSRGLVHEYIITDLSQSRTSSMECTYYATNSVQELALTFIEDKRVRGGTSSQALTRLLEDTRWTVGRVDAGNLDTTDISFYHESALKALEETCEKYGLEPTTTLTLTPDKTGIASRSVNLLNHQGDTERRLITFGRNLVDVTRKVDASDVYTRLYPYGKGIESTDDDGNPTGGYGRKLTIADVNGGLTYIQDNEAVKLWGIPGKDGEKAHTATSQDYSEITDATELLKAGQETLKTLTTPKVSYTATVAALGVEGEDRHGLGLGDDVRLKDENFTPALVVDGRVLEIDDDLLNPLSADTKITLGNLADSYTRKNANVSQMVTELWNNHSTWDDAATLQGSYVDGVIAGLNQQMNKTGGYTYLDPGEGITVYDKPRRPDGSDLDATMAIQLGGGYFRIANSRKSDGSWDWRTMGTGAGLVADVIVAGTIRGGSNYWNLDTGELLFDRGMIHDQKNKNIWDLTNSRLVTEAMVATDSILTGEFTSDSDAGDVHINQGIMDILRDVNDESKGVLRFRSAPPIDANGFGIYTQGQIADFNLYTTDDGVIQLGTASGNSWEGYIKIDGSTVTIYPSLNTQTVNASTVDATNVDANSVGTSRLDVSGDSSFGNIPDISGAYSGTANIFGNTIRFSNGVATDVDTGSGGSPTFDSAKIGDIYYGSSLGSFDQGDAISSQSDINIMSNNGNINLVGNQVRLTASDLLVQEDRGGQYYIGASTNIVDKNGTTWRFINGVCVGRG